MASMQMTKAWWVANVSGKVLKTGVADALADWVKHCKKSPEDFGSRKEFDNARATCIELDKELEKASALCGLLQNETKKVIADMLLTVNKYRKTLDGVQKKKDDEWDRIDSVKKYVKHPKIGKAFLEFARKEDSMENIEAYEYFKNGIIKNPKDMEKFVKTFIEPRNINISGKDTKKAMELYELVKKEKDPLHYAGVDWKSIRTTLEVNMSDTIGRFVDKYYDTYYELL